MTDFYNRPDRTDLRRRLRSEMPPAEVRLWSKLRGRQIGGAKFRRQFGIGPFVIDFYCPEKRIGIEVDGDGHFAPGAKQSDERRPISIESFGIRMLRFTNVDIAENLDGVLERIADVLNVDGIDLPGVRRPSATPEPPCVPPLQGGNGQKPGAELPEEAGSVGRDPER